MPLGPDAINVGVMEVEDWVVWRVGRITHGAENTTNTEMSSTVEAGHGPSWETLKTPGKVLVVVLNHGLVDNGLSNVAAEGLWGEITDKTVRVAVLDVVAWSDVESEVIGLREGAVGDTSSSGAVGNTHPVLLWWNLDVWSVTTKTVNSAEDVKVVHVLSTGGILGPVPVWLSSLVATLGLESLLVGPEVVSVPWEKVSDEMDEWSLGVVDTGEVIVSVDGGWDGVGNRWLCGKAVDSCDVGLLLSGGELGPKGRFC